MWSVNIKMKTRNVLSFSIGLVLATVFFLGCENTENNLPRLDRSSIGLEVAYPFWSNNHSNAQVVLTFSNYDAEMGTVVLPRPLAAAAFISFASSNKPTLILIAKDLLTKNEEGFILTALDKLESESPKCLIIKPHQVAQVSYPLASFYRWGQGEPDKWEGSLLKCLQPGDRRIAIWAEIAYSDIEPQEGVTIVSQPVVLKCSFPAWLFSRSVESTGSGLPTNAAVPP